MLADRQADGSSTLSLTRLEEINGGPLTDGTYVLTLQATDTNGNSGQTTVSFTLDTTLATPTFNLDPASDSAPAGDQQTANAIVMLVGHTEANALVELLGLGLITTADGTATVLNIKYTEARMPELTDYRSRLPYSVSQPCDAGSMAHATVRACSECMLRPAPPTVFEDRALSGLSRPGCLKTYREPTLN